jgi:hypothetical protein
LKRPFVLRVSSLVLVAIALVACGDRQLASPRKTYVDTDGALATRPLGWKVDSLPTLVLGGNDGRGVTFGSVEQVTVVDERIIVADRATGALYVFDAQGTAEMIGRRGRGPGEFVSPRIVPAPTSDSLLVWDDRLKRMQVGTLGASGVRWEGWYQPIDWPLGASEPIGYAHGKFLWRTRGIGGGAEAVLTSKDDSDVRASWSVEVLDSRRSVLLDSLSYLISARRRRWEAVVPFALRPSAVATRAGFAVVRGDAHSMELFDSQGESVAVARALVAREEVTPVMRATVALEVASMDPPPREVISAQLPIPDSVPGFVGIVEDELGLIWARRYGWPSWVVFDPSGAALGSVTTPAGLDVHWIGRDRLVGVTRDEFEVPTVVQYALQREGLGG